MRLRGAAGVFLVVLATAAARSASGATFTVTTLADSGVGSLREAIGLANASTDATDTIVFSGSLPAAGHIVLADALPVIDGNVTIDGGAVPGLTVDGGGAHRVFFVGSGSVRFQDLAVTGGLAQGGAGAGRGGGGLGAGGALFVDAGAQVTLANVSIDDSTAQGGAGGDGSADGGGGGGLGGDGGSGAGGGGGYAGSGGSGGTLVGGGGGGGRDSDGQNGTVGAGGAGGGPLGGAGGSGSGVAGAAGGVGGGGGGGGPAGGAGGGGGRFGGGGGGTGSASAGAGGDFGGGGGQPGPGPAGAGGYGGGGGGSRAAGSAGAAGFGGGAGRTSGAGDGGSGFGGAVFVREGGQLIVTDSPIGESGANAAAGGAGQVPGAAAGTDLYVGTGVTAEVFVSPSSTRTLSGTVSGAGGLRKTGTGDLMLSGPNDYSGGTEIAQGSIIGNATSLHGNIVNNARLQLAQGVAGTFTGSISGTGLVQKEGSGTLDLVGTNTYTGGTQISGGILRGNAAAIQGDLSVEAGTQVQIVQTTADGTGSENGVISGAGSLVKQGDGTLVLGGANTYSGGTTVSDGTLQGDATSLQGNISVAAPAALVFDQSGAGSYAGSVSGAGAVTKTGSGVLTLNGSFGQGGGTTVAAGELALVGSISQGVMVGSAGRLSGGGTVGGALAVDGTVAPGSVSTTLHAGSASFQPGAIFEVAVDPASTASARLDVAGSAALAGDVSVKPLPGLFGPSTTYTILTSTSLSGAFGAVLEDFAFLDGSLANVGNNVELTLFRNGEDFESVSATPNQAAVGAALDAAEPTASGDLTSVFAALEGLTVDEVQAALDQIGGEALTSFTTPQLANIEEFTRTITARLGVVGGRAAGGSGGVDLRPASPVPAFLLPDTEKRRWAGWVDGYGLHGNLDGSGNTFGTDWTGWGTAGGFDARIGEHVLLGAAGGYASLDVGVDGAPFDGSADIYQGAVYGTWVGERFHLSGIARYAFTRFDESRRIAFDSLDRRARASFDGQEAGGHVETGWVACSPAGVQIEPIGSVDFDWIEHDAYHEKGADSLDLEVSRETWTSLLSAVGLRVHRRFVLDEVGGIQLVPEVWGRWGHQFGDRDRTLHAQISGATSGGAYRVVGASAAADGALLGAGWSVNRGDGLSFGLYYDVALNGDIVAHGLAVGALYRW